MLTMSNSMICRTNGGKFISRTKLPALSWGINSSGGAGNLSDEPGTHQRSQHYAQVPDDQAGIPVVDPSDHAGLFAPDTEGAQPQGHALREGHSEGGSEVKKSPDKGARFRR